MTDGDAAFIPSGAPVYAVRGYATTFRLAARHDGHLVLYEADSNPAAKRGADLLDLDGKVKAIGLLDQKYNRVVVSRITEPARIAAIVQEIRNADVDQGFLPSAVRQEPGAIVVLELFDGTATVRGYDLANGVLHRGILVAGKLRQAVRELIAAAPTPTPVPATVNLARAYDLARATRVTIKDPARSPSVAPALVVDFATALDRELAARRGQRPAGNYPVVIFEFSDRVVSLAYERATDLLTVVVPDDELSVTPSDELRRLLTR
ncbi:MAG TPA: hypothetical protein VGR87_10585 [Candidatus Limnocylindria bacterium]|jgi:hypothetical protein|nr:hypothetical protein [Candidatus Limnocylindria bacterium]